MVQKPLLIIQLTGLSGTGKSTLARLAKERLLLEGVTVAVIDGDVYRERNCNDLGFSKEDRLENIRRLGEIAAGLPEDLVIIAAINPYKEGRELLNAKCNSCLVYLECALDILISRDPKGLYYRAFLPDSNPEKVFNLTGISDPFEVPANANLSLNTGVDTEIECVEKLCSFLLERLEKKCSS